MEYRGIKVDLVVKAARVIKKPYTWGISGMYTLSAPEVSMPVTLKN